MKAKQSVPEKRLPRECPKCQAVFPKFATECPSCGFHAKVQAKDVEVRDGELVELDGKRKAKSATMDEKVRFMRQLRAYQIETGKSDGFVAHKFRARFGTWPNDSRLRYAMPAAGVDADVRSWLRSQAIRYAKSQDKQREREKAG